MEKKFSHLFHGQKNGMKKEIQENGKMLLIMENFPLVLSVSKIMEVLCGLEILR